MDSQYKNVLVPVDGSDATAAILQRAIEIAKDNNAHLDILNVLEVNQFNQTYGSVISGDAVFQLTENTEAALRKMEKRAHEAGLMDVDIHIRFGNPKPIIAKEFPADHDNDIIVIGSTGLSAVERLIMGSVTSFVFRNAKCDVMIVKDKTDKK